jgi:hypothetical protein
MNHEAATLNGNAGAAIGGSKRAFARHFGEMVLAMPWRAASRASGGGASLAWTSSHSRTWARNAARSGVSSRSTLLPHPPVLAMNIS